MVGAAQAVMAASLRQDAQPRGLVRISVPKAVGRTVVHPHMPDFLALYPEVDVQMRLEDRYMDLIDDPVDLADRKSTRLNSSHLVISYAVFCLTIHY